MVWQIIALVLWVYYILVLGRIVVEATRVFARSWRPAGVAAVGLEVIYSSTDPALRPIQRLCPPLRIGTVSLDLSVLILLLVILGLRLLVLSLP